MKPVYNNACESRFKVIKSVTAKQGPLKLPGAVERNLRPTEFAQNMKAPALSLFQYL